MFRIEVNGKVLAVSLSELERIRKTHRVIFLL